MAGEEVYIARLGAFIAKALGLSASFATELDTENLGLQMPAAVINDAGVKAAGKTMADAGEVLRTAADELDAAIESGVEGDLVVALLHMFEGVYLYVDGVAKLTSRIDTVANGLPAADRDAVQVFSALMARKTLDQAILLLLAFEAPRLLFLLRVIGLVDWKVIEASGNRHEPRYVRKDLRLERIKDLIRNPPAHLAAAHKWGTPQFDPFDVMHGALQFYHPESSAEAGRHPNGDAYFRHDPFVFSRDSSVNPPGLMLEISETIVQSFDERVTLNETWGADFHSTLTLNGGVIFRVKPPFAMTAEAKAGTIGGLFSLMVNRNESARGFTIVGGNDLMRITADNVGIGAQLVIGASTSGSATIDPGIAAELKGLTLELGSKDSDSFLASLLAGADVKGQFDLALGWTLAKGLVIKAAGGIEIAIPMHQSLGPVTLETLFVILKIRDDGSLVLELSTAIMGQIGPLSAAVERMGVELVTTFTDKADADLGPLDLSLRFKPPNGVGLAVDAGVVRGGGYLYLDWEKGEYAGALELVFSGFLALKAIGIISTKMPDGSPGFSLLIIITAEFGTPIQLGYGFTLIGVGGLLGLNRTMKLEELAEGVRTGAVEGVMFPQNVVANAPKIISDLKRFFPPANGVFLIGPMAKLGWGTPTLISVSLGVIIEIPPGNIAILGVIKCILPHEEAALLVLQVKFIGAFEPTKKRLWFFASLFGSRVLFIPLAGDMGLLLAWGDDANFVLSVGGFHPKFTPPPMPFPVPQRLSISILETPFARIRVECYFAVTSNTAQFGAAVQLYWRVSAFRIEGHLGFDALFQFSPFYFIITFSASVSVKVFGAGLFSVRVRGELEGTSPWHVEGEGSVSLLFWDLDIPFSHTWGESADTVLPEIAALEILRKELEKRDSWLALPPASSGLSVSLRKIEPGTELVLHPLGTLQISQRAVPLDLSIQKIGNRKVSDLDKAVLKVATAGLEQKRVVKESFATAQYRELDAAGKLSAPGYEKQTAGTVVSVTGADTRTSHAVKRVVLHELFVIDNNFKPLLTKFWNFGKKWFDRFLAGNSTAHSPLSKALQTQKAPFAEKVKADAPGFVIADIRDNSVWTGAQPFGSHAKGHEVLAAQIAADPAMAGNYHVIPAAEARQAA